MVSGGLDNLFALPDCLRDIVCVAGLAWPGGDKRTDGQAQQVAPPAILCATAIDNMKPLSKNYETLETLTAAMAVDREFVNIFLAR